MLEQDQYLAHVGCVHRSSEATLARVLHVHVLAVVTISVFFDTPAGTVLELLGDVPPVPVLGDPICRRGTITSVHLKDVEAR